MIQEKVPFPLWVAIPKILGDQPIPVGISLYMDAMKANLKLEHGFGSIERLDWSGRVEFHLVHFEINRTGNL